MYALHALPQVVLSTEVQQLLGGDVEGTTLESGNLLLECVRPACHIEVSLAERDKWRR
jgi:hypothetical protein